nr:MAG TPA: hypothetical protein [Caudoviricetes sp.]
MKGRIQSEHGDTTAHTTTAIQHGRPTNGRGTPTRRRGCQRCSTRLSFTMPPHHPLYHPPICNAPHPPPL